MNSRSSSRSRGDRERNGRERNGSERETSKRKVSSVNRWLSLVFYVLSSEKYLISFNFARSRSRS